VARSGRDAREIHDGLQQYLFSIATHVSLLRPDNVTEATIEQLRRAASLAQQEARFAVLALSSASGNAPFDAALRRYVDVLTSDGQLEVDLEIDGDIRLAPDEQIEVFRIVQEGLANVRKHANARHADVRIGRRNGRRVLAVEDDGAGVAPEERDRIFERFTQLGNGRSGLGLGLYIARQLAEAQGGELVLTEAHHAGGARFELRLPLRERINQPLPAARNNGDPVVRAVGQRR
jgi:signal transduction histidine kinase